MTSKSQNQLLCIPQCFAYHDDGDNDFIVLQDVKYLGYDTVSRFSCLPYDQCKSFIEAIARFHAISFAYKNDKPTEFKRFSSILTENFFRNDIYETFLKIVYVSKYINCFAIMRYLDSTILRMNCFWNVLYEKFWWIEIYEWP